MVDAIVDDVVQLDPEYSHGWGPLLCIVSEVESWGVRCYALVPEVRGQLLSKMPFRVDHGRYAVIGRAEWKAE